MATDLGDCLERIVDALSSSRVEHALCGGMAVTIHGHLRSTRDIDLLVPESGLGSAAQILEGLGYDIRTGPIPFGARTAAERVVHRFSRIEGDEVAAVDVLVVTPILQPAWDSRITMGWRGRNVCVVSREGLAHMKRLAGRHQDLADLESLGIA
jgi:hypothetical protein